jgi:hypothetical protein
VADTVAVAGTAAVDLDLTAGAAAQSAAISVAEVTATAVDTALTAATTAAMAATVITAGGAAWAIYVNDPQMHRNRRKMG